MQNKTLLPAKLAALLAALLFGVSAPLSKLLLSGAEPLPLASLLYFGCGLGVLVFLFGRRLLRQEKAEAGITKKDIPWLSGAVLAGGVAAPVLLMYSLKATPASTASLLLNFEAVSTAFIAAVFFREPLGRRVLLSIVLITAAAAVLTWSQSGEWGFSPGALGILLACLLWGADNNFTRSISARDPLMITLVKGFGAGTVSLALFFAAGSAFPALTTALLALLLGALSYGASLVLFIVSMRHLGAARAGAFFGTAPFIGALLSIIIFGEIPTVQFFVSLPLMVIGAALILGEKHRHAHLHPPASHDHRHRHDDLHHLHIHENGFTGEHAHPHAHEKMEHDHPHLPDTHHRHRHKH